MSLHRFMWILLHPAFILLLGITVGVPQTYAELLTSDLVASHNEASLPLQQGSTTNRVFLPLVASPSEPSPPGVIVANHTVVGQFAQIPDSAITAASRKRVLQVHASTGGIIDDNGLNCIQGTKGCGDLGISFPLYKYDRRNWTWPFYQDMPGVNPGWMEKADQFKTYWVPTYRNNVDILSMKFCYIDFWEMMGNPQYGTPSVFEYYRDTMLELERQNPTKSFVWWTYPILRNDGGWNQYAQCSNFATINNQIRNYARANNKPLFDIADIESHDENGNACYTGCESECVQYGWPNSSDGHPNVLSAVRLGKAYWWLIARLAGWSGN